MYDFKIAADLRVYKVFKYFQKAELHWLNMGVAYEYWLCKANKLLW